MEILEAFDLTLAIPTPPSWRAARPAPSAHYVEARAKGQLGCAPPIGTSRATTYADELEEWVEASHGKVRAEVVHDNKLTALGYAGSERTTRRAVDAAGGQSSVELLHQGPSRHRRPG